MKDDRKKRPKDDDASNYSKRIKSDESSTSSTKSRSYIPMSERQQFALLKQMENESARGHKGGSIRSNSPYSDKSSPRLGHCLGASSVSSACSNSSTSSSTSIRSNNSLPNPKNLDLSPVGRSQRERTVSATSILADRDKRNRAGETALIKAAKKGDLSTVKSLIDSGAKVNEQDYAGWTALHESSIRNHISVVAYLLKHGADPNISGFHGDTALHDACKHGFIRVVKLLLRYKADSNIVNSKNQKPVDLTDDLNLRNLLLNPDLLNRLLLTKTHSDNELSSECDPSETGSRSKREPEVSEKDPYAFDENEEDGFMHKTESTNATALSLTIPGVTPSSSCNPSPKVKRHPFDCPASTSPSTLTSMSSSFTTHQSKYPG
ncbi:Ankyrin-2 [Cichlidogyrus casuarinus]|uniref:Ankyrin-2 n=1 Tax=Cichlidogyrus casuarinus TaxID=1844966 RepID=A0ABD2PPC8_9PLAT